MVPGLLLIALLSSPAWGQNRIATVDMRKIFDNYYKTKQAEAALKDRQADLEKDHKTMLDDYKKAKDEYQTLLTDANKQTLSVEEKEKRKKAAEDKLRQIKESEDDITRYERQARANLDEQRKRMRDRIVEEIRTAVNGKAKTASYSLVFDASAESVNGTPVMLFTNNENDITDAVLAQLNAAAPTDTLKPEANTPERKDEPKKARK
jgi:outer membrane protein